jgi:hypothetical protein
MFGQSVSIHSVMYTRTQLTVQRVSSKLKDLAQMCGHSLSINNTELPVWIVLPVLMESKRHRGNRRHE